ncbi:hypothetical protein QBC32DRAFT_140979 [Pseudoneurospora amorphoporcata]|uniref:Uncharacterized protein n=1 Tax=Pseudoneurospora amorphoporcata TaxID=241081 RepID=A0AAN6SGU3_9PEZI|nr:hypothetical protein QBC32DRAFT_140979 [Pseudoneurospora amorphoporcata]
MVTKARKQTGSSTPSMGRVYCLSHVYQDPCSRIDCLEELGPKLEKNGQQVQTPMDCGRCLGLVETEIPEVTAYIASWNYTTTWGHNQNCIPTDWYSSARIVSLTFGSNSTDIGESCEGRHCLKGKTRSNSQLDRSRRQSSRRYDGSHICGLSDLLVGIHQSASSSVFKVYFACMSHDVSFGTPYHRGWCFTSPPIVTESLGPYQGHGRFCYRSQVALQPLSPGLSTLQMPGSPKQALDPGGSVKLLQQPPCLARGLVATSEGYHRLRGR